MAFTSTSLTEIDLSHNDISDIEEKAFKGVSGSVDIDLSDNQLQELRADPFSILIVNITGTIDVTLNPLLCSCDLLWIVTVPDVELNKLTGLLPTCGISEEYGMEALKEFISYQCSP
ncbi:hypothetical protein Pmani_035864 [Petrolisthes manimaculis]|uniref:Uncharacterized protein n=1 Tax=Petrolisthes manimaculis TaxID=1843537 RepID=A0AAE1NJQ3_9EUCA|nr:hypothetical protein Pmani_035864 [Petrolisthes manimaculis]